MTDLRPILLAEDDENDAELTLAALREDSLTNRVVVVRDGVETLEYLRREGRFADRPAGHPAVLLLDIKMPRLDGLEVLAEVRNDAHLRSLPVVMLTSSRQESDLAASYELGVNAYVVKPVTMDSFFAAVRRLGVFWALVNEPPSIDSSPDD
jgi:two-component system, response regulator